MSNPLDSLLLKQKPSASQLVADIASDPSKLQILKDKLEEDPLKAQEELRSIVGLQTRTDYATRAMEKRKRLPYYKKAVAEQLKVILDQMMEDGKSVKFEVKDYRQSEGTLYASVSQGLLYLEDFLDPEGKYKDFSSCYEIKRSGSKARDGWVQLFNLQSDTIVFKPKYIGDTSTFQDVKEKVMFFIEEAPVDSKYKLPVGYDGEVELQPFTLNSNQVVELQELIANWSFIVGSVTTNEVKLLKKIDEKDMAKQ